MVEYVKGSEQDNWHWYKNCTQYPIYVHVRLTNPKKRPKSGLCPQCKEKEDNATLDNDVRVLISPKNKQR